MSSDWKQVDILPPLETGEVQLWRIDLAGATGLHNRFAPFLAPPEQLHSNRCRPGRVQDHFSIGRACLRILLGNASGLDSRSLPISTGVHGKPKLSPINGDSIAFNVAHSEDTILIALTRTGSVGVDVEYFDRSTDIMEVAQYNFTASENQCLAAIADPRSRIKTFYRYWTRKEAVLKADGRGLIASLASFDISFESVHRHPVRIGQSTDDQGKLFFVSDLTLNIEAAAAIAFESPESPVRQLIFPLSHPW
ncbi:4'-phosphopantetheinyl transferase family protein [Tunturibacter empetritectus]|uniref:4'-phosphopantetheinyl transferase n=1 Tax=Tunturiibacter empetritectus TaxID=3069691 RepID=A0A7W8IFN0_9BACT|nr:4'-phosphopantetheinyl transferase superfamily protein [Edaphobacter lichenicola]MBB5315456.1 4'-phosphopantetheinyl transferase [Edaphobacter lichenicola]